MAEATLLVLSASFVLADCTASLFLNSLALLAAFLSLSLTNPAAFVTLSPKEGPSFFTELNFASSGARSAALRSLAVGLLVPVELEESPFTLYSGTLGFCRSLVPGPGRPRALVGLLTAVVGLPTALGPEPIARISLMISSENTPENA